MTNTQRYRVLHIDAWGNPEDGYEWNDAHTVGHIELPENCTDAQALDALYEGGFLRGPREQAECVEYDESALEIQDRETGRPMLAIEPDDDKLLGSNKAYWSAS